MQISSLHIRNFKYIRDMEIRNIENALILVGKNNTGKTSVLDAVRAVSGSYRIRECDFNEKKQRIEITMTLSISREDLQMLHHHGRVSVYRRYTAWYEDFCKKLPSYQNGSLTFTYTVNVLGQERLSDGREKHNKYIRQVLPQIYYIGTDRRLEQLQKDLLAFEEDEQLKRMRLDVCLFESSKHCSRCFQCTRNARRI